MQISQWARRASMTLALVLGAAGALADARADNAAALRQIFADSDEAALSLSPVSAMMRGDLRYADQFGDYITPEYYARVRANAEDEMRRLDAIDRASLSREDRIAYDVFRYQGRQLLDFHERGIVAIQSQLPIDHFSGAHVFYPEISSGKSAAPFRTVQDYDNGLERLEGYAQYLERTIVRMREGMAAAHTQPKLVMENVLDQLELQMAGGAEASPFYQPIRDLPADFAAADRERLARAYRAMIGERVFGAYRELQQFIRTEYLAASRDGTPGLVSMKDGPALYKALIEQTTTTDMSAEQIHRIGLDEVERIRQDMLEIKRKVGFEGSLKAFFDHLRTDPQFKFASKQALLDGYDAIRSRVDAAVPKLFTLTPRSPFEIRPVPEYSERSQAAGYYRPGTPDGSRPGIFFVNTYDLPSRTTPRMETLFLHEAIPGHHFQIALAQENESLPNFMRFDGNTAFAEGWALYAESLGPELGMFTDPYQAFGSLDDEMLRAIRLVVDTGIHARGWSREQAIRYMLDNSAQSETDARAEVERYIAIPGQALAYKVGALTIRRLRTEAEQALGERFDPREFHAQVLDTGALPMAVLEAKIRDWIKAKQAAAA
ncbi:MAG: DUF885 domain-containing protein [Pseudomonadales bacterium]|nr:DUF885 domain-containing protein [Pseudomonadales bacterium]